MFNLGMIRRPHCNFCGTEDPDKKIEATGYPHLKVLKGDLNSRFFICAPCRIGYERNHWSVRDVQRHYPTT